MCIGRFHQNTWGRRLAPASQKRVWNKGSGQEESHSAGDKVHNLTLSIWEVKREHPLLAVSRII